MITFTAMLKDAAAASAAEYALLLSIIGAALVLASIYLGSAIGESMNDAATCMSSKGANCS